MFHTVGDTLDVAKSLHPNLPLHTKRQTKKITVASKTSVIAKVPSHMTRHTNKKVASALRKSPNPKLPSHITTCRTSKKVTFASKKSLASVRYGPCCEDVSECEKKRIWWRGKELCSIKEQTRTLVRNLHEQSDENDVYTRLMERIFIQRGDLPKEDELMLWAWVSKAHARRGLEQHIAYNAGRHRRTRVRSFIRNVLECQKLLGELDIDEYLKSEMLAALSNSHTGPEQAIAEVFGKADEAAAILQQLDPK